MDRLKAVWTVRAGIVPGVMIPEYLRRWSLTSGDLDGMGTRESAEAFDSRVDEASTYAKSIMDPRSVNWVTLDFVWI